MVAAQPSQATPQPPPAEDAVVEELQKRFRDRGLALCGSTFDAVKRCKDDASCHDAKVALLQCMQTKVCEVLHERLAACIAGGQDCASLREGMNRCLAFAYASLPPSEAPKSASEKSSTT
jgi:hypothetical protein